MSKIKKKFLPIATIIVVVLIFAFLVLKQKNPKPNSTNPIQQAAENVAQKAEETVVGSLKLAIEKGVPMRCTYKVGENEFEGYIKGKMWRGKMTSANGDTAEVIIKDNCMWSWNSADKQKQGAKICFEEKDQEGKTKDVWKESGIDNPDIKYTCLPTTVSDDKFEPPADINFIDLNQFNPKRFNIGG